jgi:hypothetical protein
LIAFQSIALHTFSYIAQFTQPGWRYLNDSASGYLDGNRVDGSYVSLKSPLTLQPNRICSVTTTGQSKVSTASNRLTVFDSKCLDASGGGTADGTPVLIWDCAGATKQQWTARSPAPAPANAWTPPGAAPPTAPRWSCGPAPAPPTNDGHAAEASDVH